MNLTSIGLLIYLAKVRPMVSNYLNFIEIFNELVLYGCTGLIAGMTDYTPDREAGVTESQFKESYADKQNKIGLAYIVMSCLTIAVTFGGILFGVLQSAYYKLKKWRLSKKAAKVPE